MEVRLKDILDVAIACSVAGKPYIWKTSDGRETRPKDMEVDHLRHIVRKVAVRYRARLMGKAARLFAKSALPDFADQSSDMMAKAHYWMSVAQNAAAVFDRISSIPIIKRMLKEIQSRGDEFTWRDIVVAEPVERERILPITLNRSRPVTPAGWNGRSQDRILADARASFQEGLTNHMLDKLWPGSKDGNQGTNRPAA